MNKIQKLTSLALALVLSLALCVPAFAAGPAVGENDLPVISLDGKKPGNKIQVGNVIIEILDENAILPRIRYIIQNRVYTQKASDNFVWVSSNNPTLYFKIDCSLSGCAVAFSGVITNLAQINETVAAGSARFFSVQESNTSVGYRNVSTTLTPRGQNMECTFSAYES